MRTTIKIDEWGEEFLELVPFMTATDISMLVCCIVDDINGLLDSVIDVADKRDVNPEKFSSLVKYCTSQLDDHATDSTLNGVLEACCGLLDIVYDELSGYHAWVNCRHKVDKHRLANDSETLTIYLDTHELYTYSPRACELMHDIARQILDTYKVSICLPEKR